MLHITLTLARALGDRLMPPPPEPTDRGLDESDLRDQHAAISSSISKTFNILGAVGLYCAITLGAPDVDLLSTDAKVSLPVIDFEVSFDAFLLAGPLLIIGLTAGLHLFVGHLQKFSQLDPRKRKPTVFNMDSPMALAARWLMFYWLPVVVLAIFASKASPRPWEGVVLFGATIVTTMALLWLQGCRCPARLRTGVLPLILVTELVLLGVLTRGVVHELPLSRTLSLQHGKFDYRDLRGFDLASSNLRDASFVRADLSDTTLRRADLEAADLSNANLSGADLARARLRKVSLVGADLSRANLFASDLSGARLGTLAQGANLARANLQGADLTGASFAPEVVTRACNWVFARYDDGGEMALGLPAGHDAAGGQDKLRRVNLTKARLCGARLDRYDLARRNMPGATLAGASLIATDLTEANLRQADMSRANLSEARLAQSFLFGAVLESARLDRANLKRADLRQATLRGASLERSNLQDADLTRADLSEVTMWDARLNGANLDRATLHRADVQNADLRGARNLTCRMLQQAHHWQLARRDEFLGCGAQIPKPAR